MNADQRAELEHQNEINNGHYLAEQQARKAHVTTLAIDVLQDFYKNSYQKKEENVSEAALAFEQLKKDIRVYLTIFGALLVGTVLTVGMYYVHIASVPLTGRSAASVAGRA